MWRNCDPVTLRFRACPFFGAAKEVETSLPPIRCCWHRKTPAQKARMIQRGRFGACAMAKKDVWISKKMWLFEKKHMWMLFHYLPLFKVGQNTWRIKWWGDLKKKQTEELFTGKVLVLMIIHFAFQRVQAAGLELTSWNFWGSRRCGANSLPFEKGKILKTTHHPSPRVGNEILKSHEEKYLRIQILIRFSHVSSTFLEHLIRFT